MSTAAIIARIARMIAATQHTPAAIYLRYGGGGGAVMMTAITAIIP
jgi:hypothetical protein